MKEAPVVSFSVIESLVYESLEANRVDLYQYARKEIIFNERDFLKALAKHYKQKATVAQTEGAAKLQRQGSQLTSGTPAYESLYNDTPLQLQQSMFTVHPSQYKFIFPQEFEDILNRLSERITAHVSELTSAMLERIFSLHTGLGGPKDQQRQAIKEEVLKEIGHEMQRFQKKYEESRELINTMRKNFLKELQHLKTKEAIDNSHHP